MHHLIAIIAATFLFFPVSALADHGKIQARISRVINNLQPLTPIRNQLTSKSTLTERMAHYRTPGVSIAVINEDTIEWAQGFGVKHWNQSGRVNDRTLFQAASISKMVFAVAIMRLVQEGRIDLDEDINNYLTSYKVPANGEWRPGTTIRQILSHSAGLTVSGFPGYSADDPIPSIADVLHGRRPANTARIEVNILPGLQSRYSGGGTILAQTAITDFLKTDFSSLTENLVFEQLAMRDSTFAQPLPRNRHKHAATGHPWHYHAIKGKWHTYPEQAAAGLWTTPTDLARLGLALQRAIRANGTDFLSSTSMKTMLTPFSDEKVGLGVFLEGNGENERFGHGGWNEGFLSEMKLYKNFGLGAVVMVNSNQGSDLINEILNAIAEEYSWPGYRSKQLPKIESPTPPTAKMLAEYLGVYEIRPGLLLRLDLTGDRLSIKVGEQAPLILHAESTTSFFSREVNSEIRLDTDQSGTKKVTLFQDGKEFPLKRIKPDSDSH